MRAAAARTAAELRRMKGLQRLKGAAEAGLAASGLPQSNSRTASEYSEPAG